MTVQPAREPGGRWLILGLLSVAELAGMSLWFTANAVAPQLQQRWDLSAAQTGWLTTAVQLGFVVGTAIAALLNLADLVPARGYFGLSALLGALANAALLSAPGFSTALTLRFLTGVCLAGVYPPAMKMVATWFRDGRGLAIGTVVGALTVGKAAPYLIRAWSGERIETVVLAASVGAAGAAAVVLLAYREGPYPFERRPFTWRLVGTILAHRPTRLATAGYLGHMWELYAMWTWIPAFVAAGLAAREVTRAPLPAWTGDLISFGAIAAGGLGCVWGGLMADRVGRARVVNLSMAISGICCLLAGAVFGAAVAWLALLTWVWGFFVVADSAQFSTMVTEVTPRHAVGTALTLQTSLGFLLTILTIQLVPLMVDVVGWRWGFAFLALGPAAGIRAISRLSRIRAAD